MKRFFLTFVMLIALCFTISAEKVIVDKVKDGYRYVQTERTSHVFLVNGTIYDGAISLNCIEKDGFEQYSIVLYFYSEYNIKKGSKLLLKFDNGDILELYSNSDIIHTTTGNAFAQISICFVDYDVTLEQLEKIMTHNVVKLRAETFSDYIDGKVYGKKFTKAIIQDHVLIKKALENEVSIYDNF